MSANLFRVCRALTGGCAVLAAMLLVDVRPAEAHPIGNFTLNLYSGIEVTPGRVTIRYVLEMAEISTQEQKPGMDIDTDGTITVAERAGWAERASAQILTNLTLIANGQPVDLTLEDSSLMFRPGQGGLDLLYMQATYTGTLPDSGGVEYRDENYADRPGWREITVAPGPGVAIVDSTVPDRSVSDELRAYPEALASDPLNVREAAFSFQASTDPTEPPATRTEGPRSASPAGSGSVLADLLPRYSGVAVLLLAVFAFGFGFVHALGPGHGKTVMAASVLTGSVRLKHAASLGAGVALLHSASVIALGLVALAASRLITSETLYSWLRVVSSVVVLAVGGALLVLRWGHRRGNQSHRHPHPPHDDVVRGGDRAGIAAAAVAGGLIPSPSAIVVMLAAIATDRTVLGIALVLTFSVGLAAALVLIGVLSVHARSLVMSRVGSGVMRWLPVVGAAVIFGVGVVLTVQAFAQPL